MKTNETLLFPIAAVVCGYYAGMKKITPSLLKNDWHDINLNWREDAIQAAIVQWLFRNNYLYTADMAGVRLTPSQASKIKQTGMVAGHPDLTIWLSKRPVFIELKNAKGRLTRVQEDRHSSLRSLGYIVHVVKAKSPNDGIEQVKEILDGLA